MAYDDLDQSTLNETQEIDDVAELNSFYAKNRYNLKVAHLNINSVRHKFLPLSNMLNKSLIDILFLQETKLDDSFPHAQFHVQNYVLYRKDVTSNCGGLMALVRSDLPQRRRQDLESYETKSGRVEILKRNMVIM
jgi:exonuclease III